MKSIKLFPHSYKKIGWILLAVSVLLHLLILSVKSIEEAEINIPVLALYTSGTTFIGGEELSGKWFQIVHTDFKATLLGVLFIIGGLLVMFSREKNEDEYIARLRLSSLMWAVLVNYLLLLFAFLFVWDFDFLTVMIYNMFTVLIIFIIRFHFILYRNKRSALHEK